MPRAPIHRAKFTLFFLLLFVLYWKAPNSIGVPATARFDLTRAIVERHTFNIDPYVMNTIDWAQYGGHYYSNKAPGVSLLCVPVYWMMFHAEKVLGLDIQKYEIPNLRRINVLVTGIPSALLSLFLLFYLLQRSPHGPRASWMAVLAYAVGTIAFVYTALLWGHQTGAAFLFFCFYALFNRKSLALVGFLFAMAVFTEYSTAVAGPALLAYVVLKDGWKPVNLKKLLPIAAGGLPVFIIFAFYHKTCFGGWLQLPARYQNPFVGTPSTEQLFGVIGIPSLRVLYNITFGLEKGLFPISPVLLLAGVGFWRWLHDKKYRAEACVALWVIFGFLWFNTSFGGWHGGNCAGPRYLVPMLPFFAAALAWVKPGRLFHVLFAISAVNTAAILAVNPQPPLGQALLTEQIYPALFRMPHVWPIFAFMLTIDLVLFILILTLDKGGESRYL